MAESTGTEVAANGNANGVASLTPREQEILAKVIMCLKTPPEIDYMKLAAALKMQNHRSASNAWSAIKKKLWGASAETPNGKTKAAKGDKTGDEATPASRKRKATSTKKKGADVDTPVDDDEEHVDTPSKKRARKAAATPKGKAAGATPAKRGKKVAAKDSDAEEVALADIPCAGASEDSDNPASLADDGDDARDDDYKADAEEADAESGEA